MYLLTFMLHFAAVFTIPDVKYDWGAQGVIGAFPGDCVWSLLHENYLGANWITGYKIRELVGICFNDDATSCKPGGQWIHSTCLQRLDVYYNASHLPPTYQAWESSKGLCNYAMWGNNAMGGINGKNECSCNDVGLLNQC